MIELNRKTYAEAIGEPVELLEPIPALALATNGVAMTPFQMALPAGNNTFKVSFRIEANLLVTGVMIRYGAFASVYKAFDMGFFLRPGDEMHVVYYT